MDEVPGYHIEQMDEGSYEETGFVWRKVFREQEPVLIHLGLTEKDMLQFWNNSFFRSIKSDGVSAIARETKNGAIVGARLAVDFYNHANPSLYSRVEKNLMKLIDWKPRLVSTLAKVAYSNAIGLASYGILQMNHYDTWKAKYLPAEIDLSQRRQVLSMMGVGVLEEHTGHRLGQKMTELTHQLAREKGYCYSIVYCTNAISQHVFEKLGYTKRDKIDYDSLKFANTYPFKGMMDLKKTKRETCSILYDLRL
jgi:ribosomal protein S18 acetylase RimI-like enzyme